MSNLWAAKIYWLVRRFDVDNGHPPEDCRSRHRGRGVDAAVAGYGADIVSYLGLWLLLARLAPVTTGVHRARLAVVLGVSCEDACALAVDMLRAPHPTVAAALGAWSRVPVTTAVPVTLDELPDQAGLDLWASQHTRGLVERFPLQVNSLTALVLATALVLQPRWTEKCAPTKTGCSNSTAGCRPSSTRTPRGLSPSPSRSARTVSTSSVSLSHWKSRRSMWGALPTRSSLSSTRARLGGRAAVPIRDLTVRSRGVAEPGQYTGPSVLPRFLLPDSFHELAVGTDL